MTKVAVILIVLLIVSVVVFAEDQPSQEYYDASWHSYQSARICIDRFYDRNKDGRKFKALEQCMEIQSTCKLIYDGISFDENRKWLVETGLAREYIVNQGLNPLDYVKILHLISQQQEKAIKE